MSRDKNNFAFDSELEELWSSHLSSSQLGAVRNALEELNQIEPDKSLKSKLLNISEVVAARSWFSSPMFRLVALGATIATIIFVVRAIPNSIEHSTPTQVASLNEDLPENELLALADFEGDEVAEDVFDPTIQKLERLIWKI